MSDRINHLAVWVAAIVYFLFGWLWYGILFKAQWMTLTGITTAGGNWSFYLLSFILGLILAYATGIALTRREEDQTVQQGVGFAVFMGMTLFATQTLTQALAESRPLGLWIIDTLYVVIGFAIMGAIVGGWKRRVAATAT